MPSFTTGALVAYGCNDRVVALFSGHVDPDLDPEVVPARVTRVERSACVAVAPDGAERPLRGRPLPAVGDWVVAADGAVRLILPRWSQLRRLDPNGDEVQTLAANVDVVIVTAPADRASPGRVERELALAWDSGAVPLVVVTKADLDARDLAGTLRARLPTVDVVSVSAATGAGIDEIRARLRPDRTAVLIGPSGAGKSTLANALLDDDLLATGAVRASDHRGRHTTTSRQLVAIPGGGVLIDTPGLRGAGLHGDVEVGAGFAEIEALAGRCRFADCRHESEPGCAVTEAVAAGALDPDRLRSFRKLLREAALQRRREDPLAGREERRVWKAHTKTARAHEKRRPR